MVQEEVEVVVEEEEQKVASWARQYDSGERTTTSVAQSFSNTETVCVS